MNRTVSGHTPGPWHASATHFGAAYDVGAENGANVALVSGCAENGASEFVANAFLIAAAPDLLETMRAALNDFDDLVASSEGVAGLHLNGDLAAWGDLCAGGRFEVWTANIERMRNCLHEFRSRP